MTPKVVRFSEDTYSFVTKKQTKYKRYYQMFRRIYIFSSIREDFWNVSYIIFHTTQVNVLSKSWKKAPTAIWKSLSNFMLLFIYVFAVECLSSFLDHTQLDIDTLGRTFRNEWKFRHIGSYLHNTPQYIRQNSMRLTGFEKRFQKPNRCRTTPETAKLEGWT